MNDDRDFAYSSVEVAEKILLRLGYAVGVSKEPGADRRRDDISIIVEEYRSRILQEAIIKIRSM